jgi:hypothetical protein
VTIIIIIKVLLNSAGAVIELAHIYLSVPRHPCVDDGVGHFWVYEFHYN